MAGGPKPQYRLAYTAEAPAVVALHADSWRRHYRGAYSDAFLDGDVAADRLAVWPDRMREIREDQFTIVAELDRQLVGFVHTILDADSTWGALVDNLHVTYRLKRSGIGTRLLGAAAQIALNRRPSRGIYLWVLERNEAAQSFYQARGGVGVERGVAQAPGGRSGTTRRRPGQAPVRLDRSVGTGESA